MNTEPEPFGKAPKYFVDSINIGNGGGSVQVNTIINYRKNVAIEQFQINLTVSRLKVSKNKIN